MGDETACRNLDDVGRTGETFGGVAGSNVGTDGNSEFMENRFTFQPIFHWKLGLRWLPNANEIKKKREEMYIANTKILR